MFRRTKIICTIGPACSSPEILSNLILGGMNVARLNFSHGTHEDHLVVLNRIRQITKDLQTPVAILQDLCGPKIRVGRIKDGVVDLKVNDTLIISREATIGYKDGDKIFVSCTYENLITDVTEGCKILMDDGYLAAQVERTHNGMIFCKVTHGGPLKSNKGINLPDVKISSPSFTEKDQRDLIWGIQNEIDYVGLSFVRSVKDVLEVKEFLKARNSDIHIIAKLEKPEAVREPMLDEIISASDGIMIARGDLGVEMQVETVPFIQKTIIDRCRELNKIVITATQMLESMIHNPRPTRAEVSDIVQAIDDGTDALMLSGETANGEYPTQALMTMSKVAYHAELAYENHQSYRNMRTEKSWDFRSIISHGMFHMVRNSGIKAIVCFTSSGATAVLVSKQHPSTIILGATPYDKTFRRLCLYRGVIPAIVPDNRDVEELFKEASLIAFRKGIVNRGDIIAFIVGIPVGIPGIPCNTIRIAKVELPDPQFLQVQKETLEKRAKTERLKLPPSSEKPTSEPPPKA